MSEIVELDHAKRGRPTPMRVRSLGDLEGKTIPDRDWLIPSVLIRRSITLFAGDGGVGKSLMCMQLQVAAALGKDWLGIPIGKPVPSFGFYCEDDDDELDRRFARICEFYGASFADVGDQVRYVSRVGQDNELVRFRGGGRNEEAKPIRTELFMQLRDEIESWGAQLVIIDTAADTFAGNENFRSQVRAFVNMIRGYALQNNGGVILNSHPSKSAMADGSGFSGSTAWNGSVRNRLYLTRPKPKGSEEEDDAPTDDRLLKVMKSNYGPFGEKFKLKWENGVFVRTDLAHGGASMYDRLDTDRKLLSAAEYLIKNGNYLSPEEKSRTALINMARSLPSCREISFNAARDSQSRLIQSGRLVIVQAKRDGKLTSRIRPAHLRYPVEVGSESGTAEATEDERASLHSEDGHAMEGNYASADPPR